MNRLPLRTNRPASSVKDGVPGSPLTLSHVLYDRDGNPIDLTGKTVTIEITTAAGELHLSRSMTIDDATAGEVSIILTTLETTQAGAYTARYYVKGSGGVVEHALPAGPGVRLALPGDSGAGLSDLQSAIALVAVVIDARDRAETAADEAEASAADAAQSEANAAASEALAAAYANNVINGDATFVDRRLSSLATLALTQGAGAAQRTISGVNAGRFAFTSGGVDPGLPGSLTTAQAITLGILVPAASAPGVADATGASGYWRRDHDATDLRLGWADVGTDADDLVTAAMAYATAVPGTYVTLPNNGTWGALNLTDEMSVSTFTTVRADGYSRINQTTSLLAGVRVSASYVTLLGHIDIVGLQSDFDQTATIGAVSAVVGYKECCGIYIRGVSAGDRIEHINLDGLTSREFGYCQLKVKFADSVTISNCRFVGPDLYDVSTNPDGVRVGDNNAPCVNLDQQIDGLTITDCEISGGSFGLLAGVPSVYNITATGLRIHDIWGQHGIYLSGSNYNFIVSDFTIDGCGLIGIKHQESSGSAHGSTGVVIANGTIRNTAGQGMTLENSAATVPFIARGTRVDGIVIDMTGNNAEGISVLGQYQATVRATVIAGLRGLSLRSSAQCEIDLQSDGAGREAVNIYPQSGYSTSDTAGRVLNTGNRVRVRALNASQESSGIYQAVNVATQADIELDVVALGTTQKYGAVINGSTGVRGVVRGYGTTATVYGLGASVFDGLTVHAIGAPPAVLNVTTCTGNINIRGNASANLTSLTDCDGLAVNVDSNTAGLQGVYVVGASTGAVRVSGRIGATTQHALLVAATATAAEVVVEDFHSESNHASYIGLNILGGASLRVSRSSVVFAGASSARAYDAAAGVAVDSTFNDFGARGVRYEAASLVRDSNNVQGTVTTI